MASPVNTEKTPRVSIVLTTFNREHLLKRALASIMTQTMRDWELIILNDASTDGTRSYLDELAKSDPRIHPVHHEKNYYPDISRALNEGLSLARGKYVARLDDDDYWCDDDKLKKQADFLDTHPDYVLTGGGTIVVDERDVERFRYLKLEHDEEIRDKALFANPFTHSTVMFRRDVARACGGYGYFKNAEDWSLWLAMGLRGKFYNFQDYFVRYLMTGSSKTFIFKRSQSREILKIVSAYRHDYPHFVPAYALNFGQYCYSLLPYGLRRVLYNSLSKAKRKTFST